MAPGDYGYQVLLHELGHALGLRHPHEGGEHILDPDLDYADNTVMTYNIDYPYATDLGIFDVQAMQNLYGTPAGTADWDVYVEAGNRVVFSTGDASDYIFATGQNTRIIGRGGEDTLRGREGDDHLNGGTQSDVLIGAFGNDSIYGSKGNETIFGGGGNDTLEGDDAQDSLVGNVGIDELLGGWGNDTLKGSGGDDRLYGGWGNDLLYGGAGHDTLQGGSGEDTMHGGRGADFFEFTSLDLYEVNVVSDFEDDIDIIMLADLSITFEDLTFTSSGGSTIIRYDTFFEVELVGVDSAGLDQSDFLFG